MCKMRNRKSRKLRYCWLKRPIHKKCVCQQILVSEFIQKSQSMIKNPKVRTKNHKYVLWIRYF